ncbi:endonuclease domain-containing 1 protein-like [Apus apus]|uniref:endonuclease domain-containing 1 protein-like n=1 Tax=Apus apus TaxID=8895 RepID=UPI0021F8BCE2|nr:endonuclease domain-containing 1 protein-like [Apus apus]
MLLLLLLQVLASCLWLGHGEVVTSLQNTCPQFFFNGIPPNANMAPQTPAWICQCYENQYHYATLYDTSLRIPVYSAYIYQPGRVHRNDSWLVEPQLVNPSFPGDMNSEKYVIRKLGASSFSLRNSQAVNKDYENAPGYHRGHLNPCSNNNNTISVAATFTLTNAVPQNQSLNTGKWRRYEVHTMRNMTKNCDITYVVAGAVPGNNYLANGRVNIPSYIWSSACCKLKNNNMKAWGVIAENNKNEVKELTLGELEGNLTHLYRRGSVSLFHSACPRN